MKVRKEKCIINGKIKKLFFRKFSGVAGSFPYFGTKVYFPKNSLVFQMACAQGIFEEDNVNLILALVKSNSVYFDVGSNIGLLAIPILFHNPTCTVVSIEASSNSLPFLSKTIEKSRFAQRWHLIPKAAGDVVGSSPFTVTSSGDGAFDGFKSTRRGGNSREILIQVTTIDTEWELLGEPDVSAIKIDIEGSELKAMHGAIKCIQKKRPYILTEWNLRNFGAYGYNLEDLLIFSKDIGYKLYSLPFLVPVENRNVLEIQMLKTEYFLLAP